MSEPHDHGFPDELWGIPIRLSSVMPRGEIAIISGDKVTVERVIDLEQRIAAATAREARLRTDLLKVVDEHIEFCGGDDWPNHMSISESHFIRTLRAALATPEDGA
jgi:hypothetical protein